MSVLVESGEDLRGEFEREGYVLVRGLFSPAETAELREAFMAQAEDGPVPGLSEIDPNRPASDPLARYPRMMHPHRHPDLPVGPLAKRTMLDARIQSVLRELLGEEPVAAQSMFYFKPPGARGQSLHQDNYYLRVEPGTCVAAWAALDDADAENGTLVVVPGSSRHEVVCPERADSSRFFTSDHVPVPPGLREELVPMRAGDVLFFNGSLIHGSYPNTSTDRFRRAFICHYIPAGSVEASHWYRPFLDFSGREVFVPEATGGGPCGTVEGAKSAAAP
jgi:phytanoyl-CoA hydroxylase